MGQQVIQQHHKRQKNEELYGVEYHKNLVFWLFDLLDSSLQYLVALVSVGDIALLALYLLRRHGLDAEGEAVLLPDAANLLLPLALPPVVVIFVGTAGCRPATVSLGAQKCFAKFASEIGEAWKKSDANYNDLYFMELIAKAILFRYLDEEIRKQTWYGGFKANIVTYTIAKFKDYLDNHKLTFNLQKVWDTQDIPYEIKDFLLEIAKEVNTCIQDTPNPATNVTEWCKTLTCWDNVKAIQLRPNLDLEQYCIWENDRKSEYRVAASNQKMLDNIAMRNYIVEIGCAYWKALAEWIDEKNLSMSEKESNILSLACNFEVTGKLPSEKQCPILIQLETRMKQEGFFIEQK